MPQLSVSSFLNQLHFLMSYTCTSLSAIHAFRLVIHSISFLPLPLFPSIFPVNARFSRPSFLITCPKNLICLVLISPINFLSTPALCRTSSLVNLSVQGILIIHLKYYISQLSYEHYSASLDMTYSLPLEWPLVVTVQSVFTSVDGRADGGRRRLVPNRAIPKRMM